MKLKNAKLNVKQTCGDVFILTEMAPVYNYVDGKRQGDPIAYNYTVVLPQRKYDSLKIRIEGPSAMEAPEDPIQVKFDGLELTIKWSQSEDYYIAGTASGVVAVQA